MVACFLNQESKNMTEFKKTVEIVGGGTVSHVRAHLALAAVAYGGTARDLERLCLEHSDKLQVNLHLTRMANSGAGKLETNQDIKELVDGFVRDPNVKIVFMNAALCDFEGEIGGYKRYSTSDEQYQASSIPSGKYAERLQSRNQEGYEMHLSGAAKVIGTIRKERKDIFLVGFKTTCGVSVDEQYIAGLNLLKANSCNLVLANDIRTRKNMIVTPEESRYHVTTDRQEALRNLVDMAYLRSHLTFTRSTVIKGDPVPWESPLVPDSLRQVVNYCIAQGAYKEFRGATVGHFACKIGPNTFLTSRRKTNFNDLDKIGLVKIETDGPDTVLAYGSKPSVGGQSQRIVFEDHPEMDCIVHAHVPIKNGSEVPIVSQRQAECGSRECGSNTSNGLKSFGDLKAVYLDNHGPNIVFNRSIDPNIVTKFIVNNFDLKSKTGGPVKL